MPTQSAAQALKILRDGSQFHEPCPVRGNIAVDLVSRGAGHRSQGTGASDALQLLKGKGEWLDNNVKIFDLACALKLS